MNNNPSPFYVSTPTAIAKKIEDAAVVKVNRDTLSTLLLAVTAGVFIGLAFVFYITVTAGGNVLPYGLNKLIGGLCFSLGLILVVILNGDLFTSTVLSITAKASKRVSTQALLRYWSLVYIGNFIGAMLLVALMISARHYEAGHGLLGVGYLQTAQTKLHHTFGQAFTLGIMCNVMVCLAVWMAYAGQTVTDKLLTVILPVAMFVAAGFEHCIANMFLIPMAIITKHVATADFWVNADLNPSQFTDVNWCQFIFHNLLPVTLGNIVGGAIFVGLTYWFIYRKPELDNNQ